MGVKLKLCITAFVITVSLTAFVVMPESSSPNTTVLEVMKIDGVWKVVNADDNTKTLVKVKKKDTIIWEVKGTDASFQFPAQILSPVDNSDSLSSGYTKFVKDGHKLKLKVKADAQPGTYEYAVFCHTDGEFARGDSPPKLIVE